ncbi:MAG: saccharopine dehydrogenase NADP-binding domain-containing protein [Planctomycetales bacterium]|nr:saccharopine dehydrogenase NADP-binding domain-containing protein [Planctomycetales bacterium]
MNTRQLKGRTVKFQGRILMLGCGSVARCTLPLVLRHLDMPKDRVTVLDMVDSRDVLQDAMRAGVKFVQEMITLENYAEVLGRYLGPGDMLVDLAWNIGTVDLLQWCHDRDVLYINTSIEVWDPYEDDRQRATDRTLYVRHLAIRKWVANWSERSGATAVLEHGANPGLVSHFTKQALTEIAGRILTEKPKDRRRTALESALANREFPRLAHLLGVKVIHISEWDTQVTDQRRDEGEFVNTWSVEGFYEEATAPAEMGWGTHENKLPHDGHRHRRGPRNQICLDRFGMNTIVKSWVPSGPIEGMVVRHGEAFTMSDYLTVCDDAGEAIYRPTVHYAYRCCDEALDSLTEQRATGYPHPLNWRIMNDEITDGRDELGCLLMGHDFKSWWIGSLLDIHAARRMVPGQNATTVQVACSVLSAIFWMIRNPRAGVCVPDQLPHDEILGAAMQYLGEFVSQSVDWMPVRLNTANPTADENWQFSGFLLPTRRRYRVQRRDVEISDEQSTETELVSV